MSRYRPPQKPAAKPSRFAGWAARIGGLVIIVAGLAAIVWLIRLSPPEKKLVCSSPYSPGLTSFGTCKTE